jgi:hypothetical protein
MYHFDQFVVYCTQIVRNPQDWHASRKREDKLCTNVKDEVEKVEQHV